MAGPKQLCQFSQELMASPLGNLKIRTLRFGHVGMSEEREKCIGRALRIPGGTHPRTLPLGRDQKVEASKAESCGRHSVSCRWTWSERNLSGVLYGAYRVGDSCPPSTCPWRCAFPLVTVKSRSHWRPESRSISPPHLEPITSSYS